MEYIAKANCGVDSSLPNNCLSESKMLSVNSSMMSVLCETVSANAAVKCLRIF